MEDPGFELVAASLRADATDLAAFVEALAVKLEGALPGSVRVERRGGGLFSREERLRTLGAEAGQAFPSDLSVPEFGLVRRAGLEPITQVLGSSVYHVGWQFMGGGWYRSSQELTVLSDAYNACRRRALERLQTEAELAGADAVVGLRVTAARYEWGSDLIEFQAIGTAVRAPGLRTPTGPALTNLSGQDFG